MKISKLLGGLFVSGFVLAACSAGVPEEAGTDVSSDELSGVSPLTVVSSSKCLDVTGNSAVNGAKLQQSACAGSASQKFQFKDLGNGQHQIIASGSGKCLDVTDVSTANGATIQQWSCGSGTNQRWKLVSKGTSTYQIQSVSSGKCLDITNNSMANGAALQQWSCGGGTNQQFKITTGSNGAGGGGAGGATGSAGSGNAGSSSTWNKANLTNFESYPDPGSDECIEFNGCTWAGLFAGVEGKQTEQWVKDHNILAVHSKDFSKYKLKTLRLKQGSKQIDAIVYDMCADSDCSGCCTKNATRNGLNFLIDIEKYSMQRFGSGDGIVEWQCLNCN